MRNELYLPAFSLTQWAAKNLPRDSMRLLGFWDYGAVGSKHLLADEDAHLILSSVGIGVRYQLGDHFSAQFDYGWQQKDPGFPTRKSHSRGHVNVAYSW
jgi:hemolysin activation/secretion protein